MSEKHETARDRAMYRRITVTLAGVGACCLAGAALDGWRMIVTAMPVQIKYIIAAAGTLAIVARWAAREQEEN